ncbi:MAG: DUF1587 domain-containing protein, partial [Myxococcota bacterium]
MYNPSISVHHLVHRLARVVTPVVTRPQVMRATARLATAALLLGALGCAGGGERPESCVGAIEPGPSPLRRLTRVEYNATIFQLLGDISQPADRFPPDEEANGFDNQATALVVSPLLAEQYMQVAEDLAAAHSETLLGDLPACVAVAPDRARCA